MTARVLVPALVLAACSPPPIVVGAITASIRENPAQGAALTTATATGGTGTFSFALKSESVAGALQVEASGAITVKSPTPFDHETNPAITGELTVTSGDQESVAAFTITVTDDLRETADGAVARYPFDGNANEVLGTSVATSTTATATADRHGNATGALSFAANNGVLSKALLGDIPVTSGSFTVAAWVLVSQALSDEAGTTRHSYRMITKRQACAVGDFFDVAYSNSATYGNAIGVEVRADTVGLGSSASISTASFPVGTWFHFAAVIDSGAHVSTAYVNGVATTPPITYAWSSSSISVGPLAGPLGVATSPCIGNEGVTGFPGSLDDLIVFDRALTAADVAALAAY